MCEQGALHREVWVVHTDVVFFINDLEISKQNHPALFTYADTSTVIAPV